MSRYEKVFTVQVENGSLEVYYEGKILYRLGGNWRNQLLEWQRTGWEIRWSN